MANSFAIRRSTSALFSNSSYPVPSNSSGNSLSLFNSSGFLPWDRFNAWVHCICIVNFDTEIGQSIELIYPPFRQLNDKEKSSICYLSFPDSYSHVAGQVGSKGRAKPSAPSNPPPVDTQFHFRFPRSSPTHESELGAAVFYRLYDATVLPALQTGGFYYGHSYFRQEQDKSLKRGYFQKSVVVVTRLPLIALMNYTVSVLAPEFFQNGEPSLEAACHDIDQWPPPVPGATQFLPFMGSVIQVRIPPSQDKALQAKLLEQSQPTLSVNGLNSSLFYPLPSCHELPVYPALKPIVPQLQMLWELVLTNEPLVFLCSRPAQCSQLVQVMVQLIEPLNFAGDFRPYVTIHDADLPALTTLPPSAPPNGNSHSTGAAATHSNNVLPSVILGVTNPYFAKMLKNWPHIIRLDDSSIWPSRKSLFRVKDSSVIQVLDAEPGVYTNYKQFLKKDKVLLKKLEKSVEEDRPTDVVSEMLRRYVLELTQSFMIPLERYITTLLPLAKNISAFKDIPPVRRFDEEGFLASLEQYGPQLTCVVRGDWPGLYRKFFRGRNFAAWYSNKLADIRAKMNSLHIEAICSSDMLQWAKGKQELEIVDMIIRIRDKLHLLDSRKLSSVERRALLTLGSPEWTVARSQELRLHLSSLVGLLPADLQRSLKLGDSEASSAANSCAQSPDAQPPPATSSAIRSFFPNLPRLPGEEANGSTSSAAASAMPMPPLPHDSVSSAGDLAAESARASAAPNSSAGSDTSGISLDTLCAAARNYRVVRDTASDPPPFFQSSKD